MALQQPNDKSNQDEYFDLGLAVLDLTRKEWEASNKEHSREDLISIGREYEKGMGW